jgi:sensor histidine kinase YesM
MKDGGIMLAVIVVAALIITFVTGELNRIYEQLVYSMCIGSISFLIIDCARLTLGAERHLGGKRWIPLLGVVLAATPIANYAGRALASLILGFPLPTMESFTTARSASMMMFTLLVISGGVLLFINREHVARIEADAAQEKARAEAVERQALQAQLGLLQAQLEPHMLFNTLANLQGLIAIDPDRASHMLDQLIQYLRATLVASRSATTTLEQEFALIDAYLGLMSVRMGERLSYRLELPDSLRDARVPPMLLQPLVENAIIHGLEPKIAGGQVVIGAAQHGNVLEMRVSDTGLGLTGLPSKTGTGVGVSNTRERLRALYGEGAGLTLEPAAAQGAVARLTLPLYLP